MVADPETLDEDTLVLVTRDIEALHAFFVAWFTGEADGAHFEEVLERRLDETFALVEPSGAHLPRRKLVRSLRAGRGKSADFRIDIRAVRVVASTPEIVVATYEEWQRNAKNSSPPDNGRSATVVFRRDDTTPGGLSWLHVQETWVPEERYTPEAFKF